MSISCVYCKRDPGSKNNPDLWDGFLDMDTNEHVCSRCRKIHYQVKFKQSKFKNLYSEFPVSIHRVRNTTARSSSTTKTLVKELNN
jgi:hypothetical protein